MNYKESTLKRFVKDYSLPIQVATNEMMPYYIKLYNPVFDTVKKWKLFEDTVAQFSEEEEFMSYSHKLIERVCSAIKDTPEYINFNSCDMDRVMPINKEVQGVPYVKTVNIYNPNNHGKYFISVDMKKANYQALRLFAKDMVLGTDTYDEFISKFTDMEYFKQSKYIRQVIFGNLNMGRITRQERTQNESVLNTIFLAGFKPEDIITFTTDEIIIRSDEDTFLNNPTVIPKNSENPLNRVISSYCGVDTKVETFRLNYIGNDTYVKEHNEDKPTFKGGSSVYFPQAYKAYHGLPLEDNDMYFLYEKQLAKFTEPMKWDIP